MQLRGRLTASIATSFIKIAPLLQRWVVAWWFDTLVLLWCSIVWASTDNVLDLLSHGPCNWLSSSCWVYVVMIDKIHTQTWQIRSLPHIADGIKLTEKMLECMLPYDPTWSQAEYSIFSPSSGTTIMSTTMRHAIKHLKDCTEQQV